MVSFHGLLTTCRANTGETGRNEYLIEHLQGINDCNVFFIERNHAPDKCRMLLNLNVFVQVYDPVHLSL